jgi:hypothetical protein
MRIEMLVVGVVALTQAAQAGVIYDNGAPPDTGITSYLAESGADGFTDEAADDFVLVDGASTIRDIHWWGTELNPSPGTPDDFTITIYNEAAVAPVPGSVAAVATILNITREIQTFGSIDVYFYSAQVQDIALAPDTNYWLGITNGAGTGWGWVGHTAPGNHHQRFELDESWFNNGGELAFYLTDDIIPAPGVMAMAGAAAMVGFRRRR